MNRREVLLGVAGGVAGFAACASSVAKGDLLPIGRRRRNQGESNDGAVKLLTDVRQAHRSTDDPVSDEDIEKIVQAGLNAPSARNLQPWFFSVATDREFLREIDKAAKVDPNGRLSVGGSPLVIFVSTDGSDYGKFDAGAAADRMNVAAVLLGYGCKTVATAAKAANSEPFRGKLQVPEGYDIFAALLIGKEIEKSVDGVSGATTREDREKKLYFYKG